MLYTVNLYSDICKLFHNKTGKNRFDLKDLSLGVLGLGVLQRSPDYTLRITDLQTWTFKRKL